MNTNLSWLNSIQDAQSRTLVRSDRSDYDQVFKIHYLISIFWFWRYRYLATSLSTQVLTKLGRPGPHYDQTVPLQVGLQVAKCWKCDNAWPKQINPERVDEIWRKTKARRDWRRILWEKTEKGENSKKEKISFLNLTQSWTTVDTFLYTLKPSPRQWKFQNWNQLFLFVRYVWWFLLRQHETICCNKAVDVTWTIFYIIYLSRLYTGSL